MAIDTMKDPNRSESYKYFCTYINVTSIGLSWHYNLGLWPRNYLQVEAHTLRRLSIRIIDNTAKCRMVQDDANGNNDYNNSGNDTDSNADGDHKNNTYQDYHCNYQVNTHSIKKK